MKSTFSRIAVVALTLWLGLAAGAANAVTLTFNGWTANSGGYITNFADNGVAPGTAPFSFSDWLYFTLPGSSTGNGGADVVSNFSVNGFNVVFDAFTLFDYGIPLASGTPGGIFASLAFLGGAVPGSYSLNIAGHEISASLPGAYSGNVTTTSLPVPEPEIYAMLLAGLGLIGFSARRRNNA